MAEDGRNLEPRYIADQMVTIATILSEVLAALPHEKAQAILARAKPEPQANKGVTDMWSVISEMSQDSRNGGTQT